MTELPCILGFCAGCRWRRQEWLIVEDPNGQQTQVLDRFCDVHDNFVPEDGYCWCFEPENA